MLAITLDENNAAVITIPSGERLKVEFLFQPNARQVVVGFEGPRTFDISREMPVNKPVIRDDTGGGARKPR